MASEFKLPDLGEGLSEAEIRKWFVSEGDEVEKDQNIVEVETDKAVVELPIPFAGKIAKIHHEEGDIVKVGETLVTVESVEGEPEKETKEEKKTEEVEKEEEAEEEPEPEKRESVTVVGELPEYKEPVEKVLATPAVRRKAKEMDIDLNKLQGTGPGERITEEDLEKAKEEAPKKKPKMVPKFDLYGYIDRKPLRGIRRTTAKNMIESQSKAAQVTSMEIIDVTELVKLRQQWKTILIEEQDRNITYLPFIMKALVEALKSNPIFNSSLDDAEDQIILKKYYNIGYAVATDEGLMVPVIKGVDQKTITEISEEMNRLTEQAMTREIDLMDLKGGSFTITNYGVFGGTYGTPIINYPEVAILGTGRIMDAPVVVNDEIKIRKVMHLSLTFDHRVMDGADAARFMNDMKKYLEDPQKLLVKIN